ncbi:C40 family peptidase [Bacillus sp. 03113]|uniref:C40 family peptidase n=1 Tax=Bacillus sp. 03113 TaxID=2578211 RepID=UPI00114335C4|nr:C40 family peptidase [Bacillus sp. 03113]
MSKHQKWLVNVSVATIWTSYQSAREMDQAAICYPVRIREWLNALDYENRLALCHQNLVQTQVLYGQEVLVVEEMGEWAKVLVLEQPSSKDEHGYPGWMPKCQLIQLSSWTIDQSPVARIKSNTAILHHLDSDQTLEISFQTVLPLIEDLKDGIKVQTPTGAGVIKKEDASIFSSLNAIPKGSGENIVSNGEQFLQLPYLWGGVSGFGYDCSGFSYSMCKANGYVIPRDAHEQAVQGEKIQLTEIMPGDLLFFAYEEGKGRIHHVGIYYGNGKMIHAPKTGKAVEIISLAGTDYETELCEARRYWQEMEGKNGK